MNDNKICKVCKIKIDEDNYKKHRTICKSCYNKKKRKNKYISPIHETKITNVNNVLTLENHRHVVIGPSNVGKT